MSSIELKNQRLGLYIHIPFCQAKCRYCGFYSEPLKNHAPERLISALLLELQNCLKSHPSFHTVYIGGGSPSCLPIEQIMRLLNRLPKAEEFTIEVNPGQINETLLNKFINAGVNRLSIGAQSFVHTELTFLGRQHSVEDIFTVVKTAKLVGFENIGLDLIFAVPGSSLASWQRNLASAIDLGVRHISAYALTYEKGTPLQKAAETGDVKPVDEDTDRLMYETAIDTLQKAGFTQYEISNFATSGFECRHNLLYWANLPCIGIGPAAASFCSGTRTTNFTDINKYIDAVEKGNCTAEQSESLTALQTACETAVLNLRRICGICIDEFQKQTGFDALELFNEPVEKYKKLGLIEISHNRIFLTRQALPVADSILCDFSDV